MSSSSEISPPKLPTRFLRWFCNPNLIEDVEGDLSELYAERFTESQPKAKLKYLLDVLLLFRPGIIKNIELKNGLIHTAMIKNYLKIIFRNALRYKGFTTLNLLGLIVGITTSTTIFLWVNDEVSIDKFHVEGDRIYQLFRNMKQSGREVRTTFTVPKPAADLMREEYPEVDQVAQVSWPIETRLELEDDRTDEVGFYVTPSFLSMFSFELLEGDRQTSLADLSSIMISRSVAEKFFGSGWKDTALGQTLTLDDEQKATVTGVFENVGDNSSLQFDWLLPAEVYYKENTWVDDWGNGSFRVYFTLRDQQNAPIVGERIKNSIKEYAAGQDNAGDEELILHKFQDYYLYSNFKNGVIDGGRIEYVKILTAIALLILIIACINFTNLATARSSRRSKEVGLRKVMGAHKSSIGNQFLFESVLTATFAMGISLVLIQLILPYFNQMVDKNLFMDFSSLSTWIYILGIILIVGLLSGSYPALLLPRFKIVNSLKGVVRQSSGAAMMRKGLVVFQFAISTFLIISISVVYKQLNYVLDKDLGLNKTNLISVSLNYELGERWETLKDEIGKIPYVKNVSVAAGNPLETNWSTSSASWEGKDPNADYEINIMLTDKSFIETTEIQILQGRDFSSDLGDSTSFLINEVAAEVMGFDDPINKKLSFWGIEGRVIGVIKNYHMQDLHESISPLIISCFNPAQSGVALVRVSDNPSEVLVKIEEILTSLSSGYELDYNYVDEAYAENYSTEFLISNLVKIFVCISIFLSCLGLFGLSAFTAEQRSKEIGVRKVHGASVRHLVLLLSKDYSILMIFAFILAIPFGYYYAQQWLDGFEFRTTISPFLFVVAGLITFIIGALTVSFKSYQAARINPVKTLKDE
ncbi:ABC-type antimicrobial peptide transport system, permease component [Ekhidna lutea]|uniref:ABC-type antimicrobial peptide transport system, permease component n=1 Tax=Ekhidna lutea TaxID=447679 RepID=A0A239KAH0_EKHLU|nr:ABC transporter permease [Ekhidna lutea]SNT14960.1 ABC-type antimicrobial peptide transport system, permease component [Ekhidna lutea]